jgi:hypothetical protein
LLTNLLKLGCPLAPPPRCEPVVEDVVAEIVVRAGADLAADAREAALLVGVEVVDGR